jgi:thiamine pyrophosphate-dependent acetolactate synthase large subunit-like protein
VAEGFGARGLKIENDADVEPVVAEAMACAEAVVVEVRTSLSHLSCWTRIEDLAAAR